MIVFVIVIPILLLAVALMSSRRCGGGQTASATGTLSGETRKRDRGSTPRAVAGGRARPAATSSAAPSWPGEAASSSRSASPHRPAPFVPPDPEALGVTRRQFLNRSIVGGFVLGLSAGSAPPCSASCGRRSRAASARRSA